MDIKALSDEELSKLQGDVAAEQESRRLPKQIEELSARFVHLTGNGVPPVQAAERGVGRENGQQPDLP